MTELPKPQRQRRSRAKKTVVEDGTAVLVEDVTAAQSEVQASNRKDQLGSERLLIALKQHHRHGYGVYEQLDKGDVLIGTKVQK